MVEKAGSNFKSKQMSKTASRESVSTAFEGKSNHDIIQITTEALKQGNASFLKELKESNPTLLKQFMPYIIASGLEHHPEGCNQFIKTLSHHEKKEWITIIETTRTRNKETQAKLEQFKTMLEITPFIATRSVLTSSIEEAYTHPVPTTLHSTNQENHIAMSTYGELLSSDEKITFVYAESDLLAGSKKDIGSNLLLTLDEELLEKFNSYIEEQEDPELCKKAYEAIFNMAILKLTQDHPEYLTEFHLSAENSQEIFRDENYLALFIEERPFQERLEYYQQLERTHQAVFNQINKKSKFRSVEDIKQKTIEKQKKFKTSDMRQSKHELFETGPQKIDSWLSKIDQNLSLENLKSEIQEHIEQNQAQIADSSYLSSKIQKMTKEELESYLKKSKEASQKTPELKIAHNEVFLRQEKKAIGFLLPCNSYENFTRPYRAEKKKHPWLASLPEYLEPNVFGTIQVDSTKKKSIADAWSQFKDTKNQCHLEELSKFWQSDPQYMIAIATTISLDIQTNEEAEIFWNDLKHCSGQLNTANKMQVAHTLIGQLIQRNDEKSFAIHYQKIKDAFAFTPDQWKQLQNQAFHHSSVNSTVFPDLSLAYECNNVEAFTHFVEELDEQTFQMYPESKIRLFKSIFENCQEEDDDIVSKELKKKMQSYL